MELQFCLYHTVLIKLEKCVTELYGLKREKLKWKAKQKWFVTPIKNILIRLLMMEIRSIRHLMHLNSFQMFFLYTVKMKRHMIGE